MSLGTRTTPIPLAPRRPLVLSIILTAVFLAPFPLRAEGSKLRHVGLGKIPNQYIVILDDTLLPAQAREKAATLAFTHHATIEDVWTDAVKGFFARMSDADAERMSHSPFVEFVEENAAWYLSSTQQTNINPATCDPVANPNCSVVSDNRLWHLDRLDQNQAAPTNEFHYCTDGTGVNVYVVDTGVNKFHNEFEPNGARVASGYNASGDKMPANDPCMGFAVLPASAGYRYAIDNSSYFGEVYNAGHGTSVASVLGGRRVGVAKGVTIVPVKVSRCDEQSARLRKSSQTYQLNETMFRQPNDADDKSYYRAIQISGNGMTDATELSGWPASPGPCPAGCKTDGGVTWQRYALEAVQTTDMILKGLNWVTRPCDQNAPIEDGVRACNPQLRCSDGGDPCSNQPGILSMSTWRLTNDDQLMSFENAILAVLAKNIAVIVSANNQNGNACDTSPARLSQNSSVITVGGSMIRNQPWTIDVSDVSGDDVHQADGGGTKFTEPGYQNKVGVRDARWICGDGDSDGCWNTTDAASPVVNSFIWPFASAGSNGGICVTVFAPAKNIAAAAPTGPDGYRDPRLRSWGSNSIYPLSGARGQASGTSFSAPMVAGFAARILQNNPGMTPAALKQALIDNSFGSADTGILLNPRDSSNNVIPDTPNRFLRFGDVNIITHPISRPAASAGPTDLTVFASGTVTPLSYQWYEVQPVDFDYKFWKRGASSSQAIAGATSSTLTLTTVSERKAYWVRASNSCGSADSDIAVVVPRPGAPSGVAATASGASDPRSVSLVWNAAINADTYQIQRKVGTSSWTIAGERPSTALSFTEARNTSDGMIVYRVAAIAGADYLPPNEVPTTLSNNDAANLASATYEELMQNVTTVKAMHVTELRKAINQLYAAAGTTPLPFTSVEEQGASLIGLSIQSVHFTDMLAKLNVVRGTLGLGSNLSFGESLSNTVPIRKSHILLLRNALE